MTKQPVQLTAVDAIIDELNEKLHLNGERVGADDLLPFYVFAVQHQPQQRLLLLILLMLGEPAMLRYIRDDGRGTFKSRTGFSKAYGFHFCVSHDDYAYESLLEWFIPTAAMFNWDEDLRGLNSHR
ncbi:MULTISPECIES: hypothetical protein [unclassified Devosia]|uniref:hypothetical protein n=1 Tax=unclassified Devosia TaxID=196773 RepID=UPI00086BCF5F|nr:MULTISPECIES: hypothetical protein [unclassified Devosia]MBN9360867.1 hypothetical protein [Devosia sp.]ODS88157.1 MAG: hypothetical protein ABS47_10400 [Devosia sp. SCN 66-27]